MAEQISIKKASATKEALVIPVNYNDPSAVDPPAKALFCTQASITQFLTRRGATSFKYLDRVWRALPDVLAHDITFNVAAGVQRPSGDVENSTSCWMLDKKLSAGRRAPNVLIQGAAPSSYIQVVAPLSITSVDTGDPSRNPSLTFSGTPFAGLNLRGRFAILNTGQAVLIHDHTDSVLYVLSPISPIPATAWVGRPSTIFRNSLTDTVYFKGTTFTIYGNDPYNARYSFQDIAIEPFDSSSVHLSYTNIRFTLTRFVCDGRAPDEEHGIAPNGRVSQNSGPGWLTWNSVAVINLRDGSDSPYWVNSGLLNATFTDCYFQRSESVNVDSARVNHRHVVYDQIGREGLAAIDCQNGSLNFYDIAPYGKECEIRDSPQVGISLYNSQLPGEYYPSEIGSSYSTGLGLIFKNTQQACIRVKDKALVQTKASTQGLKDGGGNLDVGIELTGRNSTVVLDGTSDITGALGDVRMNGGDIHTYADIVANGPYTDLGLNVIEKAS